MANQKMPDYETIRAAVAGEAWAVAKLFPFSLLKVVNSSCFPAEMPINQGFWAIINLFNTKSFLNSHAMHVECSYILKFPG